MKHFKNLVNYFDEQLLESKTWGDIAEAVKLEIVSRDQAFWQKACELSEEDNNRVVEYNTENAVLSRDKGNALISKVNEK